MNHNFSLSIKKQHPTQLKKATTLFLLSLLFLLLIAIKSYAQNTPLPKSQTQTNKTQDQPITFGQYTITGTVLDDKTNLALKWVNIVIQGTVMGTVSDSNGRFKFKGHLKDGQQIQVSYLGYQTQLIKITQKHVNKPFNINLTVRLKTQPPLIICVLLGAENEEKVYRSKRSFWQKIQGLLQ